MRYTYLYRFSPRNKVPYNPLHDQGYTSIGDVHSTQLPAATFVPAALHQKYKNIESRNASAGDPTKRDTSASDGSSRSSSSPEWSSVSASSSSNDEEELVSAGLDDNERSGRWKGQEPPGLQQAKSWSLQFKEL
jgi:3'-phosphoadenosine 5'-phosphosulfate sulfotransferase (PAPS reductase)/FAD synthetase